MKVNNKYSFRNKLNYSFLKRGLIDGIPIALGYFAVSFSLGISASNAGLTPFQGFLVSMLCNASAGEYAGFKAIATQTPFIEIALVTLITNARYLLMSCAMSQKVEENLPISHRLLMSYDLTDEIFSISMAQPGYTNPFYTYGAVLIALPSWAIGTALGIAIGNIMPIRLVSAFSVSLYGMFLASIIPPTRKSKVLTGLVLVSFLASYLFATLPIVSNITEGTRTIILTVVISTIVAFIFPKKDEKEEVNNG